MSDGADDRVSLSKALRRVCPSSLNALRLAVAILFVGIASFWVYFHAAQKRTVVVDVTTGSFEIELASGLNGKALRGVYVCQRGERTDANPTESTPIEIGCPRSHQLYGPFEGLAPRLPAETKLRVTSLADALRIDVVSVPVGYEDTDIGQMQGGAYVIVGEKAIRSFGTLPLSGAFALGARFNETDRMSITDGRFQIRGYTPWGLLVNDTRELRGGTLQAGARLRLVDRTGETAEGHLAVMLADAPSTLMRVTGLSEHDTSNLVVRYYFTDEVIIRPSFIEAVILDPFFQLLATVLGMIAGYSWLRRLLSL